RTNSRRWRSSVNLPAAASPDKAPALRAMPWLLLDPAARGLDRGASAGRDHQALQHQLLADVALLDDLGPLRGARHQLGGAQRGEVDLALEAVQLVQEHFRGLVLLVRAETDLREAHVQGHLAALEAGLDLALAGTGVLALV